MGHTTNKEGIRFIRKGGKVIPIKGDGKGKPSGPKIKGRKKKRDGGPSKRTVAESVSRFDKKELRGERTKQRFKQTGVGIISGIIGGAIGTGIFGKKAKALSIGISFIGGALATKKSRRLKSAEFQERESTAKLKKLSRSSI